MSFPGYLYSLAPSLSICQIVNSDLGRLELLFGTVLLLLSIAAVRPCLSSGAASTPASK